MSSQRSHDGVRCWLLPVSGDTGWLDRFADVLWPDEVAKGRRYSRQPDRVASLAGAALVRRALGSELDIDPRAIELDRTCRRCGHRTHGKPRLISVEDALRPLSFNLSHTQGLVVMAVAPVEVGVDVERTDGPELTTSLDAVLSPAERRVHRRLPPRLRDDWLLRRWTAKEAYIKGTGAGLVEDPTTVRIGRRADSGWSDVTLSALATEWQVRAFEAGAGFVASLALQGPPRPHDVATWPVE